MATLLDGNLLLYKYLTSVNALMTEVSNRLYGPPASIPSGITAACKFLLFTGDGGAGNPDVPMTSQRYTVHCYGATQTEAQSVYRTLADALNRAQDKRVTLATGSIGLLRFAVKESGPYDLPEPETEWPRVISTFRVHFCEWTFAS
jgi:hypothetical protein